MPTQFRAVELSLDQIEQDDLRFLFAYWNGKRGARFAPSRASVDPLELTPVLMRLMLVDPIDGGRDFRFRLAGTGTFDLHGREITHTLASGLRPPAYGELVLASYRKIMATRQPVYVRFELSKGGRQLAAYHILRLPLSSDGERVDMLLVGENYGDNPRHLRQAMEESED